MRNRSKVHFTIKLFVVAVLFAYLFSATAAAQTTAFSYQGSLKDGANPANGSFQMQFKLFDSLGGAGQIGSTITDVLVTISQGTFAVKLDFGTNALSGANRWLEIAVRRNSGESYVTLSPREQIASAPYSVRTLSAATADMALDSQKLGGVNANQYVTTASVGNTFIKNDTLLQTANFNISGNGRVGGNFGIGTTTPGAGLEVRGTGFAAGQRLTDNTSGNSLVLQPGSGNNMKVTGYNYNTSTAVPLYLSVDGANTLLNSGGGLVGIGTTSPTHTLDVNGFFRASNAAGGNVVSETTGGTNAWAKLWTRTPVQTWSIGTSNNFNGNELYFTNENTGNIRMAIKPNGNMTQDVPGYGLPKAMLYIDENGAIIRCYNGITGLSSGNCGFTVSRPGSGQVNVDFGFEVQNSRFVSITSGATGGSAAVINFIFSSPNVLIYLLYNTATFGAVDRKTMVIVY